MPQQPKQHKPQSGSYQHRADRYNARYQQAYSEWLAGLSAKEREALAVLGVNTPEASYKVAGHAPNAAGDIADSPRAQTPAPEVIETPDIADSPQTHHPLHESLCRVVGTLMASSNTKMDAAALAYALNLDVLNGMSTQDRWAKENHISATILGQRIDFWIDLLGLPKSRHQKTDETRAAFSKAKSGARHHKKKLFKANPRKP